jgi:hypothetical protein
VSLDLDAKALLHKRFRLFFGEVSVKLRKDLTLILGAFNVDFDFELPSIIKELRKLFSWRSFSIKHKMLL